MGWTFFEHKGKTNAEIIRRELGPLVAESIPGGSGTGYVAVKTEAGTWAVVVLIDRTPRMIGLKYMDEFTGPSKQFDGAPRHVMDALSPLTELEKEWGQGSIAWAREWRQRNGRNT